MLAVSIVELSFPLFLLLEIIGRTMGVVVVKLEILGLDKLETYDLRGSTEDRAEGGKEVTGCEGSRCLEGRVKLLREVTDLESSASGRGVYAV